MVSTSPLPAADPTLEQRLLVLPTGRAAYSDRGALLMARLSRLAYERFEGDDAFLDGLATDIVARQDDPDAVRRLLRQLRASSGERNADGRAALEAGLAELGFTLVDTFCNGGTQAYLAHRESDRMAVLAFRGTEKDFSDIRTDLDAYLYDARGARIHHGFWLAYQQVRQPVGAAVAGLACDRLFVTGHSLGGALAMVATRDLDSDRLAACYTFGAPRVGGEEFGFEIKAPVYRVVNASDVVPGLPPTWTVDILRGVFEVVDMPFVRAWLDHFRGYRHYGALKYLTPTERPDDSDVQLLDGVHPFRRVALFIGRLLRHWRAGYLDHRIDRYCAKLHAYAIKRLEWR